VKYLYASTVTNTTTRMTGNYTADGAPGAAGVLAILSSAANPAGPISH
jgi:hypothetical protein